MFFICHRWLLHFILFCDDADHFDIKTLLTRVEEKIPDWALCRHVFIGGLFCYSKTEEC